MFYDEGGETLEHIVQRNYGCSITGSIQDQTGWSSEQLHLVEDVPAHGKELG